MRKAEVSSSSPYRAVWRILLGVLVIAIVFIIAMATNLDIIQKMMGNPSVVFADTALREASVDLAEAESRLMFSPNDETAHLNRARAYITFGFLEGARLEWGNNNESGASEWGDVARTLDELRLKTDEIRALLLDAEASASPADHYPPIYRLLEDIAEGYDGIPHYRALFLQGYLLLREGRRAEAQRIFGEELANYVALEDYVKYNYARSLIVTGTEDEALEEFDTFLEEYPSSRLAPIAHLERINILRDLERPTDALNECYRALDNYPDSPFAAKTIRKIAELYEAEMDFDNGGRSRVRLLRDYPESDEVPVTVDMFFGGVYAPSLLSETDRLIVAYAAIGRHPSDAFEILSALADSENLTPEERSRACHGAGRIEYSLGRYYECIDWANRARDLAPGTEWADRAGIRKGHAYWQLDKLTLAKEAYWDVARGHGPVASVAAEILWQRAFSDSDIENVQDACRYIVDEYPDSDETPAAMTTLAYLALRDREYTSAQGYAERCIDAFPSDPAAAEAGFWLAMTLEGQGRNVDADETFVQLANRVPWNYWGIRAREHLGVSSLDYSSIDPFDYDPNNLSVYEGTLARAWELYDAGVLELAESEFALAKENEIPGARAGLALVYAEHGRLRDGVLEIRDGAAMGDQAYMTPETQRRLLNALYPRPFEEDVRNASLAHDVSASWLWGAMRQESCYNPNARSTSDARGLIQIMPQTGRFIADQRGAATFDPETLWDPALNLDFSAWYFSYLRGQVRGDNLLYILAAYNGGPGRFNQYWSVLPNRDDDIFISAIPNEETRNFAHWVYANVRMYDMTLRDEGYQLVPF